MHDPFYAIWQSYELYLLQSLKKKRTLADIKSIQEKAEITNKQVVRVLTKCNGLETTSILPFFNQSHAPNEFLYHGNASKVVPLVQYCVLIPFSLPYWHGHLPYNKGIEYFFAITSCYRFVERPKEDRGA